MPEDFQPNELRLTHKGATHVPTIRPSQPPNNSRNPRGSYRGDGPSPSYMHNKTAPDVLRQHPLISNPSSVSGLPPPSVVPIPIRHELPKKPSHSWDILTVNPPDELSRRFDRRIRHELPTRPQDLGVNERPLKRPRLDIPPSSTSNQYDTVTHINATAISAPPTRYPEIASKTAGTPSQPSETPDFLDIVISLPIECRRGKPYNKRNRHTWIEAQIEHLEAERGVKLILWDINGPNVRFRCSAAVRPPGDQQVSQPAEANSSLVHLQLGDNSSYEAVEEKSFTHIRSSPPVLVQDVSYQKHAIFSRGSISIYKEWDEGVSVARVARVESTWSAMERTWSARGAHANHVRHMASTRAAHVPFQGPGRSRASARVKSDREDNNTYLYIHK